jgi:3-oxoacyl-[acyl-carrier protein] reductase
VRENSPPKVPPKTKPPAFQAISIVLITGCNIAINYANSAERAEKFSRELRSTYPNVKIVVIQADVGVKSACEKLVTETISQLGGLDVIISNAGI